MRLLTVTHFFETHGGGIERVAGHLCRRFAVLGHRPVWAASREDALPDGVESVPLACFNAVERYTGLPLPIPGLGALRRLRTAAADADALVIHDSLYVTSIVGLVIARRLQKPVVLIQHVADIPFSNAVLRGVMRLANRWVTRNMLRAADRVVFISATTRDTFAGVPTKRPSLVLFNGVDGSVFDPRPAVERGALRRHLGLPEERRIMLFVGRFVAKKGLSALLALARSRPDLTFVLAGKGPIDPQRWGLPNVTVRSGLAGADLAALYRAADLLLLPSVGEGYPLVVQEAMACGLPVVCGEDTARADPDAAAWLIGVPVDLAQPAATAARLSAAIDRHRVTEDAKAKMSRYAIATYDWKRMATAIVAAIDEMRTGEFGIKG